jgi:hypothetical protein
MDDEQKKIADEADEITLYFIINECGSFIWRMNHDMADSRIPQEHHAEIDKDIIKVREFQSYSVSLLPKFGVEIPTQNGTQTNDYWKWFRWWDNYVKGLPTNEWLKLENKMNSKEDYSMYRPQGNWKE